MNNLRKLHESLAVLANLERQLKTLPLPAGVRAAMASNLFGLDQALRFVASDISAAIIKEAKKSKR